MHDPTLEQAVYWLVGALGMPLIEWLKRRLGLSGPAALWLALGVAVLLAVIALALNGDLRVDALTPETALPAFAQVLAAATLAYKLLLPDGGGR